jgi:hypothetical protein
LAILKTRASLQGRLRTELRILSNDRCKKMEADRAAGKVRGCILYLLGSKRTGGPYRLEELATVNGLLTDPLEVHNTVTDWFRKWFATSAATTQEGVEERTWSHLQTSEVDFLEAHKHLNVKTHALKSI